MNEQLQQLTSDIELIQSKLVELTNLNDRFHQINNQQTIKIKQLESQVSQQRSSQSQTEKMISSLKQEKSR